MIDGTFLKDWGIMRWIIVLQINEFVDARDLNMGAWFEAQIKNVTKAPKPSGDDGELDGGEEIMYHVKYEE